MVPAPHRGIAAIMIELQDTTPPCARITGAYAGTGAYLDMAAGPDPHL